MTSPYIWLRKKDIDAVKIGIKNTKNMLKYYHIEFKCRWYKRRYYKDVLKNLISEMRACKMIIDSLYKKIPVPLHIDKDTDIICGKLIFYTDTRCPSCGKYFRNQYDDCELRFCCGNCGQVLWWNDQINDTLDRYENGNFDGIHRRLKG